MTADSRRLVRTVQELTRSGVCRHVADPVPVSVHIICDPVMHAGTRGFVC